LGSPSVVRVILAFVGSTVPQDLRRLFDELALATRQLVGQDPQSGAFMPPPLMDGSPVLMALLVVEH